MTLRRATATFGFLDEFAQIAGLRGEERNLLAAAGVRSYDEVDSLVRAFPSLARAGLRLSVVSNAAAHRVSAAYAAAASADSERPEQPVAGAHAPDGTSFGNGAMVPVPTGGIASAASTAGGGGSYIDLRPPNWPVRDQGRRGTCVAFGVAAAVEHLLAGGGRPPDLSEQFLYHEVKTASTDPRKDRDGTLLRYARDMLAASGICDEPHWPYADPTLPPIAGPTPTRPAYLDACTRIRSFGYYAAAPISGAASEVKMLLTSGRPVVVTLPCFVDPLDEKGPDNWTTRLGRVSGRVLDPPPTSVVRGGHCVLVTGFAPDAAEPNGGYFVVRNSWGTAWGASNPTHGYPAPEPGYGEVSATYVDTYAWELLQL